MAVDEEEEEEPTEEAEVVERVLDEVSPLQLPEEEEKDAFPSEDVAEEEPEEYVEPPSTEPSLVKDVQEEVGKPESKNKSYKEILIEKYNKSVEKAYEKAESLRLEKEKEMAIFIRQNEKLQEHLKDLWTQSSKLNTRGYFKMVELFEWCIETLKEQSEILRGKQKLDENPYWSLLDMADGIVSKLHTKMNEFEMMMKDTWAVSSERLEAEQDFMNTYRSSLPFIKRFVVHTLSGTIIMTERWKGKEEVTGKPKRY